MAGLSLGYSVVSPCEIHSGSTCTCRPMLGRGVAGGIMTSEKRPTYLLISEIDGLISKYQIPDQNYVVRDTKSIFYFILMILINGPKIY